VKVPCERVARQILPAIRSVVARRLAEEYGLTQTDIAKRLGVKQATVSLYLYSKRGGSLEVQRLLKRAELADIVDEIVRDVANDVDVASKLCKLCARVRELLPAQREA